MTSSIIIWQMCPGQMGGRARIFAELKRVSPSKGDRFTARVDRIIEEFGKTTGVPVPRSLQEVFLQRLIDPEDRGHAVSAKVRDEVKRLLSV